MKHKISIEHVLIFPDGKPSALGTLTLSYIDNVVTATIENKEIFRMKWNTRQGWEKFDDLRKLFKEALERWPEPDKNLTND